MMLDLGAKNYNEAVESAARYGHLEMMLDLGANDYNNAITAAASSGQQEIVNLLHHHQQEHQ